MEEKIMERTFDPIRDAENYYNECERTAENQLKCKECGKVVIDDRFSIYKNHQPFVLCEDCFDKMLHNVLKECDN